MTAFTEAVLHARTLVHRLRGAAGSYGFESVSASAGRIEDLLLDHKQGAIGAETAHARIVSELSDLASAVARELAETAGESANP